MNKSNTIFKLLVLTFIVWCYLPSTTVSAQAQEKSKLNEFLEKMEGVRIVKKLPAVNHFTESYELRITQPLDHLSANGATFEQRVYISHTSFDSPMVMVTEGYGASRNYTSELSDILQSNQIIVEHRFFLESKPEPLLWEYMNVKQAAADHHRIVTLFKELYDGKWAATGISKGGQTTIYHRWLYPNDVDVSVPYVAPLIFLKEDPRVYTFLANVGTAECRARILDYQRLMLKKQNKLLDEFEKQASRMNYTFNKLGVKAAYEYSVFEYDFAFWQWGASCDKIPDKKSSDKKLVESLINIAAGFFADADIESNQAFFYQALTEIGFYGYNITPFKDLVQTVKQPDFSFCAPAGEPLIYNPHTMQDVYFWLQDYGNNFIYIYGEYDAWTACAVPETGRTNALKMVKKEGSHATRIKSFKGEELDKIYKTLEEWMDVTIER